MNAEPDDREDRAADQALPRSSSGSPAGASGCRPKNLPTDERADVVQDRRDDRSRKEGDAVPVRELATGRASRAENEPSTPTQTKTKTVEAVPSTGEPRSTPIRYQSIVPTEEQHHDDRDRRRALGISRHHHRDGRDEPEQRG